MVARLRGAAPGMVLTVLTGLTFLPKRTATFEQAALTISTEQTDFCFTKDEEVF